MHLLLFEDLSLSALVTTHSHLYLLNRKGAAVKRQDTFFATFLLVWTCGCILGFCVFRTMVCTLCMFRFLYYDSDLLRCRILSLLPFWNKLRFLNISSRTRLFAKILVSAWIWTASQMWQRDSREPRLDQVATVVFMGLGHPIYASCRYTCASRPEQWCFTSRRCTERCGTSPEGSRTGQKRETLFLEQLAMVMSAISMSASFSCSFTKSYHLSPQGSITECDATRLMSHTLRFLLFAFMPL